MNPKPIRNALFLFSLSLLWTGPVAHAQTNYEILKSFDGALGANPNSALIEGSDGRLYGTTIIGGVSNLGTVFALNKDGGGYSVLRSFTGGAGDGRYPMGVVEGRNDGVLYGT